MGNKKLVIVESPTKAKTIRKFLGSDFLVESCMGHVRDLPKSAKDIPAKFKKEKWAQLGVNTQKNFAPIYVIPKDKNKVVKNLKEKLAQASELYLATDEDREGESISWHLYELLEPTVPVKRMVFNEITQAAIQKSLEQTRSIDLNLVRAQESRRILDRLVGYTISPLLWKKIAYGLSAGRVQSVAVRLIVEREAERMSFVKTQYWDIKAKLESQKDSQRDLQKESLAFDARLVEWAGQKIVSSHHFNSKTGELKKDADLLLLDQQQAQKILQSLSHQSWIVKTVESKPVSRKPMPPFITSTLQQEASRKLGMTSREAMQVAQKLYEQGYITYMRTDSTYLSEEAILGARKKIGLRFGGEYLPEFPRTFDSKKVKGAQEAHEAIRPAGSEFVDPENSGLSGPPLKLYELIWKRTLASQMADSRQKQVSVKIQAGEALFSSSGMTIEFPGFLRVYVEGHDDPHLELEQREVRLPSLVPNEQVRHLHSEPVSHETKAPFRFTEASLVQLLEKEGIGRPSTYASIMGTIVDRGYIRRQGTVLIPTFTAFVVTRLLRQYLSLFVDVNFTSSMENSLDQVASGDLDSESYLEKIYFDKNQGLLPLIESQEKQIDPMKARGITFDHLPGFEFRVGKYGAYVAMQKPDGQEVSATVPDNQAPADVTTETVLEWIQNKEKGVDSLGSDPETGLPIYVLGGRYGYYVQKGDIEEGSKPKRVSLPTDLRPEDVTFPKALQLLSLPKTLGEHPEKKQPVVVSIGRFGPYVSCDGEFRSVPKDQNFLEMSFDGALQLLNQPKGMGRGRGRKKVVLKELGLHPQDQKPMNIYSGPYGPYVNWGSTNASLPPGVSIETATLDQALVWLSKKQTSTDEGKTS
jgi:DNA topoisomerase I